MTKENIRIAVFDAMIYDHKGWPPTDAVGCLEWFKDKIGKIPPQHRGAARIEFESEEGYEGEHYPHITIEYWREETDKEAAARERAHAAWLKDREKNERKVLADLLKKYGRA